MQESTPVEPVEVPSSTHEEDISNEAYTQRHERALADERKKFITFLKFPYSTRSRANRRIDSQSSGANTPDPMSPAPSTPATATNIDQEVCFISINACLTYIRFANFSAYAYFFFNFFLF